MFKITENINRMKHLAKDRKSSNNVWFAIDEKNFISEVKKISKIDYSHIFSRRTSDDLLWEVAQITPEELDQNDPTDTFCDAPQHLLEMGHWHGWSTTMYKADFIEDRGNFSSINPEYSEYPISEFEAYKAFLEYVSPGIIIEEIRISSEASTFMPLQSGFEPEVRIEKSRVA